MKPKYPIYSYSEEGSRHEIARFVKLDNPECYPFDSFHSHAYNEILVFIKGGGNHNINFIDNKIADNSIHLLAAHDLHLVERGMQSHGFAIVYKDIFLYKLQEFTKTNDLIKVFSSSTIINLDAAQARDFQLIFKELSSNSQDSIYTLSLIGAFLTKIASLLSQGLAIPHNADPVVQEAFELINSHYHEHLPARCYAAKLCLPLRTLERRMKAATGRSLNSFIQDKILTEAKRKIVQAGGNLHIGTIADDLGFKEIAHFTNWFKRMTGKCPSRYIA